VGVNGVLLWAGVGLIGGVFAIARFLLDAAVSRRAGRSFPYGTLAVNLSGAALLGLLTGLAPAPNVLLLAGTGAMGAYTTFSTWMFESQRLAEERQPARAAANILVSVVAGVLAAAVGRAIGGAW
jgi:CrcB protein